MYTSLIYRLTTIQRVVTGRECWRIVVPLMNLSSHNTLDFLFPLSLVFVAAAGAVGDEPSYQFNPVLHHCIFLFVRPSVSWMECSQHQRWLWWWNIIPHTVQVDLSTNTDTKLISFKVRHWPWLACVWVCRCYFPVAGFIYRMMWWSMA